MENRKRNIQMKFYVTEEEKRLIDEKMKQLPIKQYGAYFRKMAIDGYILVVDRSDTKAYIRELGARLLCLLSTPYPHRKAVFVARSFDFGRKKRLQPPCAAISRFLIL